MLEDNADALKFLSDGRNDLILAANGSLRALSAAKADWIFRGFISILDQRWQVLPAVVGRVLDSLS
jgi:hypothetical protein